MHTTSENICFFGAGGHAKVVRAALTRQDKDVSFYYIDQGEEHVHHAPITTTLLDRPFQQEDVFHIAIGDIKTRRRIALENDLKWLTIIDPTAIVHSSAKIGAGSFIGPGVIINPDVRIGQHCIVNSVAIIEHDVIIGNYTHIAPGSTITGNVHIGEATLVGANSVINPTLTIGNNTVIGSGSTVIKSLADNVVSAGNPSRPI